jgi:MFS family permease
MSRQITAHPIEGLRAGASVPSPGSRVAPARGARIEQGFGLFWAARAVSQFGDEISVLALPWLVAELTASPMAVALLEALIFVPVLLLGLPIGALADRRSRKRSMVESDVVRLAIVGSIPLAMLAGFGTSIIQVLAVAVVAGTFRILFEASSQAALTDLVPPSRIVASNARLSMTEGLATICGPALAGVLIATIGTQGAIGVDALTFAISGVAIALVAFPRERFARTTESMREATWVGMAVVRDLPHLRALTMTFGAGNVAAGMALAMTAIFLQQTLGIHGWQAGVVYAMNGVGGLMGGMLSARLVQRIGLGRSTLAGMAAVGAGIGLLGTSAGPAWAVPALTGSLLVGLGIAVGVIASASLRQRVVPATMLGRVTAAYRMVVNGAIALGAIIGGVVAQVAGIRVAIIGAGALIIVVVVASLRSCLNGPDPVGVDTDAA